MANRKTKYKTITHIPGKIGVTLPNGTRRTFQNSSDALAFFDQNYGDRYSMEITSTTDNNGEVTINGGELPEVEVVGQSPADNPTKESDPVREGIFEGRYNGRRFSPTPANIQHFLDLYESDKRIAEGYGDKAWGKVLGTHVLAGAGIYGAITAPAWLPSAGRWLMNTGGPAFAKHIAAPTAAGMLWDEGQRALTGTTSTETISNYLLQKKGWNPVVADMTGGLSNPGYWINFGGAGKYTRPLFNKVGLGLPNPSSPLELSPTIQANVNALMPKSKFKTKVVEPATQFIDRNLYQILRATSPWLLLGKNPISISTSDLPRFKFVRNPSELRHIDDNIRYSEPTEGGQIVDYLLFRSNTTNDKVFGDAMNLRLPTLNTKFYTTDYLGSAYILDKGVLSPITAGISAVDIAASDDRNPYIRGLEYGMLGRFGLLRLAANRVKANTDLFRNYREKFSRVGWDLDSYFQRLGNTGRRPAGWDYYWDGVLGHSSMYVPSGSHNVVKKPGFNYKKASFDDLVQFISKNKERVGELGNFLVDGDKLFGPSGALVAERGANNQIKLANETELRNILSRNIDIVDYNTGQRFTGKISVSDDGSVQIPEEYTNILRGNIDYVLNTLFPGSGVKVFGSSAGVADAGFPHATHDIDFYITQNELDKLILKGMLSDRDKINPGTYTYRLNPSLFGELGNIDLNVLEQTPNGMATGIRAEELFKQYFPDDYFLALRDFKARQANGDPDQAFHINRTPEELLSAMNPPSKTIMDSFDIDYTAPAKGKHALRSWAHLVYSDPQLVSRGINLYALSMLGSRVLLFPMSAKQLGDKELNLQALKKLGINLRDFELERIASDPLRMKNVLDAWYMMDNTAMRYIRGTWPGTTGSSSENFIRSATTWDPVNNGGNAHGAGLNTTIGGDSLWYGDLKAYISPNTLYRSTGLLDMIDEVNNNFGRNPEAGNLLYQASRGTPEQQVENLLRIYREKGWNFLLDGLNYGAGMYASATRPFDINTDFIGFSPTRTVLNPIVPRVKADPNNNPISLNSWRNPFTRPREIPPALDYHKAKPDLIGHTLKANRNRLFTTYNPLSGFTASDVPAGKPIYGISGIVPGMAGLGYGISLLLEAQRESWIDNIIKSPNSVVQKMPDQDKRMFTPEGVDSLYQKYLTPGYYDEDDIKRFIYYDLRSKYDEYDK